MCCSFGYRDLKEASALVGRVGSSSVACLQLKSLDMIVIFGQKGERCQKHSYPLPIYIERYETGLDEQSIYATWKHKDYCL